MAKESHEFTGKTVDEAIAEGLKSLHLRAEQVDIEVISKGSRGIFGLGSEPAQVRLVVREAQAVAPVSTAPSAPPLPVVADVASEAPAPVLATAAEDVQPEPELAETIQEGAASDDDLETIASELLTQMVHLMGFTGNVQAAWKEGGDDLDEHGERYLLLNVKGGDLGSLIGRRGETLDNIQYLLRLMVNQRLHRWTNIVVDVDGYKERRANQLRQLAMRTATQVASTGRSVSLEPMPANERRIIHIVLRDHAEVYTESAGEGERRKVHIIAKT